MTDELLTKLDAADPSSNRGSRRRLRSCCDVIVRVAVALHLVALALLVAWAIHMTLLETPTILSDLAGYSASSSSSASGVAERLF